MQVLVQANLVTASSPLGNPPLCLLALCNLKQALDAAAHGRFPASERSLAAAATSGGPHNVEDSDDDSD